MTDPRQGKAAYQSSDTVRSARPIETGTKADSPVKRKHIRKGDQKKIQTPHASAVVDFSRAVLDLRPPQLSDKHALALRDSLFKTDAQACRLYGMSAKGFPLSRARKKYPEYWQALCCHKDQLLASLAEAAAVDATVIIAEFLQKVRSGKVKVESVKEASFLTSMVTQLHKVIREAPAPAKQQDQGTQAELEQAAGNALERLGNA